MQEHPTLPATPDPAHLPNPAETAANDPVLAAETHAFRFTGSGAEYFKIWIVNLLLSIVTLGVYSAWAKVRRLQYFDRNTHLAGAVFDFDGKPQAILRGRLLAVALLALYQYAFGFSLAVGISVIVILLLSLPFMMRSALIFRLSHTRYRGLRFGFDGSPGGAYLAYSLPLTIFLLPAVLLALDSSGVLASLLLLLYLLWPLMHGMMKRYQHRHLQFGSHGAHFNVPARRFYGPYLTAIGVGLLGLLGIGLVMALMISLLTTAQPPPRGPVYAGMAFAVLAAYMTFLLAGPYLQVRIGNLAWSATSFPGMSVSSHLKARGYMKLQLINTLLTLLSAGLYRPFAVVRAYQYRLAHMTVTTAGSFEHVVAAVGTSASSASGDGMSDLFGLDLSW